MKKVSDLIKIDQTLKNAYLILIVFIFNEEKVFKEIVHPRIMQFRHLLDSCREEELLDISQFLEFSLSKRKYSNEKRLLAPLLTICIFAFTLIFSSIGTIAYEHDIYASDIEAGRLEMTEIKESLMGLKKIEQNNDLVDRLDRIIEAVEIEESKYVKSRTDMPLTESLLSEAIQCSEEGTLINESLIWIKDMIYERKIKLIEYQSFQSVFETFSRAVTVISVLLVLIVVIAYSSQREDFLEYCLLKAYLTEINKYTT